MGARAWAAWARPEIAQMGLTSFTPLLDSSIAVRTTGDLDSFRGL